MKSWFIHHQRTFIVWGMIVFFVAFSFSPTIYEWGVRWKTKPARYFELVHNFPTDYNFYLSRIRQGKEGAWLAREKYTSEPHDPSLSQVLYVLIGRASDWAHIQTPYIWISYHVMRLFFAALLLYVIWKYVASHNAQFAWQALAFLVVITASTWPKLESVAGWPRFGAYMAWWTQANELQRITFLPHVLFGQAALVFVMWVLSGGFITRKHPGNYIFLGVVGLVMGIVFPPALLFSYAVIAVLTIGEFISLGARTLPTITAKKKREFVVWSTDVVLGRFVYGILSVPALVYYMFLFRILPWKRLVEFDIVNPPPFEFGEYFLSLGPTLPLGVLGLIVLFFHRTQKGAKQFSVAASWVIAWFGVLYIFTRIPQQSPMRFGQMAPHVPLGILTMYLFTVVISYLRRIRELRPIRHYVFFIPMVMVVVGLLNMASSFLWLRDFVDHKLRADIPLVPKGASVMYPLGDIIESYKWLEVYTPRDAVVLADETTSNYIPVYSGNTTFIGHANTVELETKLAATRNFYRNILGAEEEQAWIAQQEIDYIMYGPEEKENNGWQIEDLRDVYPLLELVYENPTMKIYRLK